MYKQLLGMVLCPTIPAKVLLIQREVKDLRVFLHPVRFAKKIQFFSSKICLSENWGENLMVDL